MRQMLPLVMVFTVSLRKGAATFMGEFSDPDTLASVRLSSLRIASPF
jgi:ABC-type sulfate transport system permease subunit